eukprot:2737792-Rhodomonas_salina.1
MSLAVSPSGAWRGLSRECGEPGGGGVAAGRGCWGPSRSSQVLNVLCCAPSTPPRVRHDPWTYPATKDGQTTARKDK